MSATRKSQHSLTISGTRGAVQMDRRKTIGSEQNDNCEAAQELRGRTLAISGRGQHDLQKRIVM